MADITSTAPVTLIRRIDRVVLAAGLVLIVLSATVPAQALASLSFTLQSLLGIAPYLLFAVAVAAYTTASGADQVIGRAFQGRPSVMILAAALFGALSPFCSCGVIPIIGALLAMGMPLPAVMAFWLASPIMDPEMFVLTAGGLGIEFAVAKTLAAAALGLFGGFASQALMRIGAFEAPLRGEFSSCGTGHLRAPEAPLWAFWRDPARRATFVQAGWRNLLFLGKWLMLAFLLESLMLAYLPAESVGQWVGGDNPFAVPLAALVGAPAYLNGYAAIPTAAALIELGMTPGAALAFMVAGAVTSIPAAVAVFALVRRPIFLAYLAFGFTGSMLAGWSYGLIAA